MKNQNAHNVDIEPSLPRDPRAERTFLAAIILDPSKIIVAAKLLTPSDFYSGTNGTQSHNARIFKAMLALAAEFTEIHPNAILDYLHSTGQWDEDLPPYLTQLPDGEAKITDLAYHARVIKAKAHQREIIALGREIYDIGFEECGTDILPQLLGNLNERLTTFRELAQITSWRNKFHTIEELPDGDIVFLIDQIIPEGVTFIGGLSGVGKTWFALSVAKALTDGRKFLGVWNVPEAVSVLYLCPEMNARAFRHRCKKLGMGGERFRCITISDGAPLDLADTALVAAVRELKPVIILDTAIRFSNAKNENSASDNQTLARSIFALIHAGARALICLHHRSKDSGKDEMILENTLRGTSDLGAIADAVWGLQYDRGDTPSYAKESRQLVRLQVRCVKARDFSPPDDFRIQLAKFIEEIGDLGILSEATTQQSEPEGKVLARLISDNPQIEKTVLEQRTGIGRNRIESLVHEFGWTYDRKTKWNREQGY